MTTTHASPQAKADSTSDANASGESPAVDVAALGALLLGRWADVRREARRISVDPVIRRVPGENVREHRDRTVKALHRLVELGVTGRAFPKRIGGQEDPGSNISGFEELVLGDPSVAIKGGVQWGLFGSAILLLGTQQHHDAWLEDCMKLRTPGAFAMTETGHGSDVASVGTTATYDPETEEFVIHTPFRGAWKDYLGNAAESGVAATVFAQLITQGRNHGVHAFYVPIRDPQTKAFLPGVGGEDDGVKGGLNGVDNGRLHFTNVRIPRFNLLNRYGDVAPDGTYASPIASPGRRFFTMLGALVQGRVSLDGSATAVSKLALAIAIKYGDVRRQFSPEKGAGETVLLDYGRHQRRLLTRLAEVYAMNFAHEDLMVKYHEVFSGEADTDENRQDLETLAAALKPLSTWAALDILQEAREACGGQGFLAVNRIAPLRADMDIWVTFEGDNNVLLQLVGKRLLTDYAKRMSKPDAATIGRYVADQVGEAVVGRTGLRQLGQNLLDFGSTARSVGNVRDTEAQRQLLTDRVETMVADVAQALRAGRKLDAQAAAELFSRHQNDLILAARAHAELLQWEAFTEALEGERGAGLDADTRQVLTWLRDLFGLGLIERNLAWYLMNGKISASRARAITDYIDGRLLPRIRRRAVDLVDAFEYPDELIGAGIATGDERARQDEARAYYAAQTTPAQ
ncbi:MAG: acyl-CoA dehydrogenase family protein [Microbacteriaceae bacterium]|nr:acyl-CoA dehydrogenase family protein [Microbacteriaceae bacterium]